MRGGRADLGHSHSKGNAMTENRKPATLAQVLAFLLGEASLDGLNFGDAADGRPRYWWRHHLREATRRALFAVELLERVEHLAAAGYEARVQLREGAIAPHVSAANVHDSVAQAVDKQRAQAWRELEDERDRLLEE